MLIQGSWRSEVVAGVLFGLVILALVFSTRWTWLRWRRRGGDRNRDIALLQTAKDEDLAADERTETLDDSDVKKTAKTQAEGGSNRDGGCGLAKPAAGLDRGELAQHAMDRLGVFLDGNGRIPVRHFRRAAEALDTEPPTRMDLEDGS